MVCAVADNNVELAVGTEQTWEKRADLGSSYYFSLAIQLGLVSNLSGLSVLLSGSDPLSSTSSIHLCSPTITSMTSGDKVRQTSQINIDYC